MKCKESSEKNIILGILSVDIFEISRGIAVLWCYTAKKVNVLYYFQGQYVYPKNTKIHIKLLPYFLEQAKIIKSAESDRIKILSIKLHQVLM